METILALFSYPRVEIPDDIVNEGGKDLWLKYIEQKVSLEDFIYSKYSDEVNLETAAGKNTVFTKNRRIIKTLKSTNFQKNPSRKSK